MHILSVVSLIAVLQTPQNTDLQTRLDSIMRDAVTRYRMVGVSAAVLRGHDTLLNRGYGYADIGLRAPATATTRYRVIGPHLAAAVMQQVDRGRVRLDDDMSKVIANFPWQGKRITLRQLMDATSGLPDFRYLGDAEYRIVAMPKTADELVELVANLPLTHEPGATWQWTAIGFHFGGALVEQLSGEVYEDYLRKNVFAPAHLQHTHACGDRTVIPELARTYSAGVDEVRYSPPETPYPYMAVVCATAGDAAEVMRAMRDGRLMRWASYEQLITAEGAAKTAGTHGARGIGLRINNEEGRRWVGEIGTLNGFTTVVMDFPDDSLTVALLANSSSPRYTFIARNLARAVFGLPPVHPAPLTPGRGPTEITPLTPDQRRRYVGKFVTHRVNAAARYLNFERTYRIIEQGGRLFLHALGEEPQRMYHQEGDTFAVRGGRVNVTVEGERAVAIEVVFGDEILRGARTK